MPTLKDGFSNIDQERSDLFKSAQEFFKESVDFYLKKESTKQSKKISILLGHTGTLLLLKAILESSFDNRHDRDLILATRVKHVIRDYKLVFEQQGNSTVGQDELLTRLKNFGYEGLDSKSPLKTKLDDIEDMRNDIVHRYSSDTENKVNNLFYKIIDVLFEMVDKPAPFLGGERLNEIITLQKGREPLSKESQDSFDAMGFIPKYSFKCFQCDSEYLKTEREQIDCLVCEAKFNRETLISMLRESSCFANTHEIIGLLFYFISRSQFSDDEKEQLNLIGNRDKWDEGANGQVFAIRQDEDIAEFYEKLNQ